MKLNLSHIFEELKQTPNFQKVRVGLFSSSSSWSTTYGDEWDDLPGSNSNIKSDIEHINVTPIMSVRNPKFKEVVKGVFSEDELYDMNLGWGNNESGTNSIICAEGVLVYEWDYDEDYSGGSSSKSLDIDTLSDDKWQKIKDVIKPILDQSDINNAIKDVGEIKRKIGNQYRMKFGGDERKVRQRDLGLNSAKGYPTNNYEILKTNSGKFGLFLTIQDKSKVIIPPIFDKLEKKDNSNKIVDCEYCYLYEGLKGNYIFIIKIEHGKISIIKKESVEKYVKIFVNQLYYKYLKNGDEVFEDIKYGDYDWRISEIPSPLDMKSKKELIIKYLKEKIENEKTKI